MQGRVTGIGGFFFRAKVPAAMKQWYLEMLGIQLTPENYEDAPWRTDAGTTVFEPFPADTKYFGGSEIGWMINFRVDDLDAVVKRLSDAGHSVEREGDFPNGRFAKVNDPEGNAIQLWEPGGADPG